MAGRGQGIVRGALAVAVPAAVVLLGTGQGSGFQGAGTRQPEPEEEVAAVEIYAAADWYLARPEPEQRWQGVLKKLDPTVGPAGRTTLSYALRTGDRQLPVYAAGVQEQLAPFVGRSVLVVGKLVDLSGEGLGQELWIASIHLVTPPSDG